MARGVAGVIRAYKRVVSPLLGRNCRFYPSCSSYALGAVERFGALRGCYLGVRRLFRCHPWHPGGVDHVPENFSWRQARIVDAGSVAPGTPPR